MWIRAPRTVTSKLNVYIGATTSALLILTVWVSYYNSKSLVESQTNAEMLKEVQSLAGKMDDFVAKMAELPNDIALHQQSLGMQPTKAMLSYLARQLEHTQLDEAQSLYIAFEKKNWTDPDAMIRVDRQSGQHAVPVSYDYHDPKREWYSGPKSTGEAYLSEPFFDVGRSNMRLVSISQPVYDERGGLIGVAGADIPLSHLETIITKFRFGSEPEVAKDAAKQVRPDTRRAGEYGFLVSRGGTAIAHPSEALMLTGDADEEVTNPRDVKQVTSAPRGSATVHMYGMNRRVFWATAPTYGWKAALSVPEAAILLPLSHLALSMTLIGFLAFLLMVTTVTLVAQRMAEPVKKLTAAAANVEADDYRAVMLDDVAAITGEIGQLARGFQRMVLEVEARQQRMKQAEEAQRRSEQHFRSLIEHASDVITLLDKSGIVQYESPSSRGPSVTSLKI